MAESEPAAYEMSVEKTHSTVVLRPPLADAEWSTIEKAGDDVIRQISDRDVSRLMVDLTPLSYMGSSMVALIVRCWKTITPRDGKFAVVTNSEVVREVLELSGLGKMWTIVDSPDEGLRSMGISPKRAAAVNAGRGDEGWTSILGSIALLVAVVGVGVWFAQPAQRQLATGLIYGGAGVAFAMGLVVMLKSESQRKFLGLGLVLLSVGAGVFRLVQ